MMAALGLALLILPGLVAFGSGALGRGLIAALPVAGLSFWIMGRSGVYPLGSGPLLAAGLALGAGGAALAGWALRRRPAPVVLPSTPEAAPAPAVLAMAEHDALCDRAQALAPADRAVLAHRAALRALPVLLSELVRGWSRAEGFAPLPALRCALLSRAVWRFPGDAAVAAASRAAADAARGPDLAGLWPHLNARDPDDDGRLRASAARAEDARAILRSAARGWLADRVLFPDPAAVAALGADLTLLDRGQDPGTAPLWHGPPPAGWLRDEARALRVAARFPGAWAGWAWWWAQVRADAPEDAATLRRRALLEEAVWIAGPDAVAARFGGGGA